MELLEGYCRCKAGLVGLRATKARDIEMKLSRFLVGAAVVIGSFVVTLFLLDTYSPQISAERTVLKPPFSRIEGSTVAWLAPAESLNDLSDAPNAPERSPFMMYENDKQIGPPHSTYLAVTTVGKGQFLHWIYHGFIFSATDNSDPNTNGRVYKIARVK